MRLPVLLAVMLVIGDLLYRAGTNKTPTSKQVFSWAFILTFISVLSITPLASTADLISYIIVLIIVLNDGYDLVSSF